MDLFRVTLGGSILSNVCGLILSNVCGSISSDTCRPILSKRNSLFCNVMTARLHLVVVAVLFKAEKVKL